MRRSADKAARPSCGSLQERRRKVNSKKELMVILCRRWGLQGREQSVGDDLKMAGIAARCGLTAAGLMATGRKSWAMPLE